LTSNSIHDAPSAFALAMLASVFSGAAVTDHARQGERQGILGRARRVLAAVDRRRGHRVHW
jgi:hypothetical protein